MYGSTRSQASSRRPAPRRPGVIRTLLLFLLLDLWTVLPLLPSALAGPRPASRPAAAPVTPPEDERPGHHLPSTALEQEETLERSGLRFHFSPADRLAAQELSRIGGRVRAAIAADLGRDDGGVLDVYLAHDREAFAELLGGNVPEWMAGVAFGASGWTALRLDRPGSAPWRDVEETFRHELSHLLLRRAVGPDVAIPRWFNEGFAIYQAREWSFERAQTLTRALLQGRIFSLAELSGSFPERPDHVRLAYAQSVAFTGYLLKQGEEGQFTRLLDGLTAGQDFPDAVAAAYGSPLEELEQQWQAQLERDYAWAPLLLGSGTLWLGVALLFVAVYLLRRQANRRRLARWEAEERAEQLLLAEQQAREAPTILWN